MSIKDYYLFTGGDDKKIKIWNMNKDCKQLNS